MPITDAIVETDPDGAAITVSQLDDHQRTSKRQIRERMEDSLLDTGVATWNNTTTKELQEGTARIHTAAAAPISRLVDGKVWVHTAAVAAGPAVQYREGAGWVDLPIATPNIINLAVTRAKIANGAPFIVQANATQSGADDVDATVGGGGPWLQLGGFSTAITARSTSSFVVCVLQCRVTTTTDLGGGAVTGGIRIVRDPAGAAVVLARQDVPVRIVDTNSDRTLQTYPVTLIGYELGLAGAQTYRPEFTKLTGVQANEVRIQHTTITGRWLVLELV